jgi:nitrite reductase/ring-hydroxylating ferredoxin subunit
VSVTELVQLCRLADVPDGEGRTFDLDGTAYAVFNLEGEFFVLQDQCTHGPGSLGEGIVEDGEVECDFHNGRFKIATGEPTAPPCVAPVAMWEVTLRDGAVWIDPKAALVSGIDF